LEFSETMLAKARNNAEKLGYSNVEFVAGANKKEAYLEIINRAEFLF